MNERDYRPRLRPDVLIERAEGQEGCTLVDPVHGRRLDFDTTSYGLVQKLDGTRAWEEIAAEVALRDHIARDAIDHALRLLLLLHLVEGAGSETLARVAALKSGQATVGWSILAEARFACMGSGECCQNYAFGPLTDADCKRIDERNAEIEKLFPEIGYAPFYEPHENHGRFLRTIDDRCVFLRADNRCGLHAAFGAEVKPNLCQIYPYIPLATIDGVKLYDNGECASFATSARSGPALKDEIPRLEKLLARDFSLYHPIVTLGKKTLCDYGYFLPVQSVLCDLVALRTGTATETVLAAARYVRAWAEALAACPLRPGEPELTMAGLLAVEVRTLYPGPGGAPAPSAEALRAGAAEIAAITYDIMTALSNQIARAQPSPRDLLTARLARELAQVLHVVHTLAAARAAPESAAVPDYYREIAAVPAGGDEIEEILRISMRQQLFGHRAMVEDRPIAGMLRLAIAHLAALFGAKLRAACEGAPAVRPQDLSYGHMLANRVFRLAFVARAFVRHEENAWLAIDALPALLAG
jgi:Fe-S-cluster containining protein